MAVCKTELDNDALILTDSIKQEFTFPSTLEGFGYEFVDGRLRYIVTGALFEFEVLKDDAIYNRKRFQALCEIITQYIYDYVKTEANLVSVSIPDWSLIIVHEESIEPPPNIPKYVSSDGVNEELVDVLNKTRDLIYTMYNERKLQKEKEAIPKNPRPEPTTFFFHTKDAFKAAKIVILIHGFGTARAGQWSQRLIIKDSLHTGTQLPYIQLAQELGYGVFILNPNDNFFITRRGAESSIPMVDSPDRHAYYVMTNFVEKAAAKHIAIIGHGTGGLVIRNLFQNFDDISKYFSVAFIDSPHTLSEKADTEVICNWFMENSRNWICSHEPLNTPIIQGVKNIVTCVSAGTSLHDLAPSSCLESVFEFFNERLAVHIQKK